MQQIPKKKRGWKTIGKIAAGIASEVLGYLGLTQIFGDDRLESYERLNLHGFEAMLVIVVVRFVFALMMFAPVVLVAMSVMREPKKGGENIDYP